MSSPRSIRFAPTTLERLTTYAARHPGVTGASAAARLVEEGLRMDAHPGIVFRDGPAGRRAVISGGPDVWEIIRSVRATRLYEPDLAPSDLLALVASNTGANAAHISVAVDYYGEFAEEIDAFVAGADTAESMLREAMNRTGGLLGG